jgi:hypothetical protein
MPPMTEEERREAAIEEVEKASPEARRFAMEVLHNGYLQQALMEKMGEG